MVSVGRSAEADAFLETVEATAPNAVSACAGWTTHEVAAHVAGISVEVVRHLEPYLQGDPVPKTRPFEDREAPLLELSQSALLRLLDREEIRMRGMVSQVLAQQPDAIIPWTGREMAVAKFIPHLRNEHALHRWDLAGDDDVSQSLLGGLDLVDHSVEELGHILLAAGRDHDPDPQTPFDVRLRTNGQPDLRVLVDDGSARLAWAETIGSHDAGGPVLELDPGARHLFIWGRRPDRRGRVYSHLSRPDLARLQILLSGY